MHHEQQRYPQNRYDLLNRLGEKEEEKGILRWGRETTTEVVALLRICINLVVV